MNKNKQRLYSSPEAEVMEAGIQTVICLSNTSTSIDDMPETDMDINF